MSVKQKTSYIKTDDKAELYYEVHGTSGPVLVFSNGLACPINHWHNQIEHFSKNFRVLAYDLRGHHKSSRGLLKKITMDLLAHDLLKILDTAFPNESSALFFGHSYGVPISLKLAALAPEKCKALVLVNGFYKNPFSEVLDEKQIIDAVEAFKVFSLSAPRLTKWIWKNGVDSSFFRKTTGCLGGFNPERMPVKDMEIYSKAVASIDLQSFLNHFKALIRFNFSADSALVKCPTLIVHGERDQIIQESQNIELAEMIENSFYQKLSEGSHCTPLDVPVKLNKVIEDFIETRVIS